MKCYRLSAHEYALIAEFGECDAFAVNDEVFDASALAVISQRLPIRVHLLKKREKAVSVVMWDGSAADITPQEYEKRKIALERIVRDLSEDSWSESYYLAMAEKAGFELKYKPVIEQSLEIEKVLVIDEDSVIDRMPKNGNARPYALAENVEDEKWAWVSLDLFRTVEKEARRMCANYNGLFSCRIGYAHPGRQKVSLVSNIDGAVVWEQAVADRIEGPESHVRMIFNGIMASMEQEAERFYERKRDSGRSALLAEIADRLDNIHHGMKRALEEPKNAKNVLASLIQRLEEMIAYVRKLQQDA